MARVCQHNYVVWHWKTAHVHNTLHLLLVSAQMSWFCEAKGRARKGKAMQQSDCGNSTGATSTEFLTATSHNLNWQNISEWEPLFEKIGAAFLMKPEKDLWTYSEKCWMMSWCLLTFGKPLLSKEKQENRHSTLNWIGCYCLIPGMTVNRYFGTILDRRYRMMRTHREQSKQ